MSQIPGIKISDLIAEAIKLRKTLHRYPEVSGQERQTAGWIKAFLDKYRPDQVIEGIGGHSMAAIFDSQKEGPTLMLRADMDALPILEINDFPYKSQYDGVSHKCGHDGHSAILAAISAVAAKNRPSKGRLVLLFQAEEETGQGAEKVIKDPKFQDIRPDYIFSLHNLPGFKKHTVIIKEKAFASASKGVIIKLQGSSSHAAHPEKGNSPGPMLPELIDGLLKIPQSKSDFQDFTLITVIHVHMGEVAFGTNPGDGVVMATLRSYRNVDMQTLTEKVEQHVRTLAATHKINADISYAEVFPATHNNTWCCEVIEQAAASGNLNLHPINMPFRWSEDFGHFTLNFPGALFGIGAGRNYPSLHQGDYDFPDEIIKTGVMMFYQIADQILNLSHKDV